jgi:hypothetical protein
MSRCVLRLAVCWVLASYVLVQRKRNKSYYYTPFDWDFLLIDEE